MRPLIAAQARRRARSAARRRSTGLEVSQAPFELGALDRVSAELDRALATSGRIIRRHEGASPNELDEQF